MRVYSMSVTVYSCHLWNTHLLLLEKYPEKQEKKSSKIQIQMDTVRVKNRDKFLLSLHHLLPLPPSRPCCLWCEARWRPVMSLCLFRQSCLKLWCVTRAERYCLRPTSVCRRKASRQCLHLPQEDKGRSERPQHSFITMKPIFLFSRRAFPFLWEVRASS